MGGGFKDHFSDRSDNYARYRPTYPDALFEYLAAASTRRDVVWDCATGNGQAAVTLADHFASVVATDASSEQIDAAIEHERVDYRVAPAESSGLADASVDLVTVGQAFHWFDAPRFIAEAGRVLRDDGVLAIWCYETCTVSPECDKVITHLYDDIIGPFWPPERALIEEGYASVEIPGQELEPPEFDLSKDWTVVEMLGYVRTWSACKRYAAANREDPVALIEEPLRIAWGDGQRRVRWPLKLRLSRPNALD